MNVQLFTANVHPQVVPDMLCRSEVAVDLTGAHDFNPVVVSTSPIVTFVRNSGLAAHAEPSVTDAKHVEMVTTRVPVLMVHCVLHHDDTDCGFDVPAADVIVEGVDVVQQGVGAVREAPMKL